MYYIQYFTESAMDRDKIIEACGDRAVVIIDGRQTINAMHLEAKICNGLRRPVYKAYQLMTGESFTRSSPISPVISL